ncbi:hypothetical protein L226DRAFT_306238 [Lentinus tigrinus ALCF2SS1-7]|uniref:uncharacterized protein n=1 Tax=Lentinus tigrinus ALCF2SS1-7 TaxID=1328758 RepID=UPI001165E5F7|nr:hypothetical protein L226DRAFT_306238 [Lentinus tigrinus ALCF2SS1-7]
MPCSLALRPQAPHTYTPAFSPRLSKFIHSGPLFLSLHPLRRVDVSPALCYYQPICRPSHPPGPQPATHPKAPRPTPKSLVPNRFLFLPT